MWGSQRQLAPFLPMTLDYLNLKFLSLYISWHIINHFHHCLSIYDLRMRGYASFNKAGISVSNSKIQISSSPYGASSHDLPPLVIHSACMVFTRIEVTKINSNRYARKANITTRRDKKVK